jgi:hypothetical protein
MHVEPRRAAGPAILLAIGLALAWHGPARAQSSDSDDTPPTDQGGFSVDTVPTDQGSGVTFLQNRGRVALNFAMCGPSQSIAAGGGDAAGALRPAAALE